MDEQYPRNISVGFDGIPDGVDAAFALPASSYLGRERAYFFKGILLGMHDIFFLNTMNLGAIASIHFNTSLSNIS